MSVQYYRTNERPRTPRTTKTPGRRKFLVSWCLGGEDFLEPRTGEVADQHGAAAVADVTDRPHHVGVVLEMALHLLNQCQQGHTASEPPGALAIAPKPRLTLRMVVRATSTFPTFPEFPPRHFPSHDGDGLVHASSQEHLMCQFDILRILAPTHRCDVRISDQDGLHVSRGQSSALSPTN